MVIQSTGNVGIGTSSISDDADHCKLVISGQAQNAAGVLIFQDTSNNEDGMVFADNGCLYLVADRANATGSSFMAFRVDGSSEKMRLQSTGVLNIGDTTASSLSDRLLQIGKTDRSATYLELRTSTSGVGGIVFSDGTGNDNSGYRGTIEYVHSSDYLLFKTSATERARITSGGVITVGGTNTSPAAAGVQGIALDGANGYFAAHRTSTESFGFGRGGTGLLGRFFTDGTAVGNITITSNSTAYNSGTSDRTVKKNFEEWTEDTLSIFKNLNPQKFNFITENDSEKKTKGFIAQDLVEHFPEAYPKDETTDKYWFNPSGMVVYLMKAIQELEAEVAALKAA